MTGVEDLLVGLGLVVGPICAAALVLWPSRGASIALLFGVFVGAGTVVGFGQQIRIGAGLILTGAICCAILLLGFRGADRPFSQGTLPSGRAFRLAAVLLVGSAVWGLSNPYAGAVGPLTPARVSSGAVILGMALLQLGLSQEQGAAALGLLSALAGFEMLYIGLEPSLALRAVLAGLMLGIALVSSILLAAGWVTAKEDRRR